MEDKTKVTITATDRIGRTESITLILSTKTAERLKKASKEPAALGEKNDHRLTCELNEIYDRYKEWQDYSPRVKERFKTEISKSQFYRLRDFYDLVFHKFYNYTLTIA